MKRIGFAAVASTWLLGAPVSGGEPEVEEIVRGSRSARPAPAPRVIEIADEPATPPTEEGAASQRTADPEKDVPGRGKKDDAARRQKELEDLARRTREEFRKAANALAGE